MVMPMLMATFTSFTTFSFLFQRLKCTAEVSVLREEAEHKWSLPVMRAVTHLFIALSFLFEM